MDYFVNDFSVFDSDKPKRAGAVAVLIRSFEIDCEKTCLHEISLRSDVQTLRSIGFTLVANVCIDEILVERFVIECDHHFSNFAVGAKNGH